jgi:dTMP kinase
LRGKFITFEGPEGSGKSTQLAFLRDWMEGEGLPFLVTREPGGTELGKRLRDVLLGPVGGKVEPVAELLLFEADRAQHIAEVICPALDAGTHVLCDRFTDSTLAYQAFGRGLPEKRVRELNALASGGLVPDLTLLIEGSMEENLRRARGGTGGDRMEEEDLDFHERVWSGFLQLQRDDPARIRLVPKGSVEEVHDRVRCVVAGEFGWAGKLSAAKTQR